jgi:glycosyltransferase involved in cell wall biosynthesis
MLRLYNFFLDHRPGGPHAYMKTMQRAMSGTVNSMMITTGRGPFTDVALLNLRHRAHWLYLVEVPYNILKIVGLTLAGVINRRSAIFNVHGSANLAPVVAAKLLNIPVVWHFHETVPQFRNIVHVGCWMLKRHPHELVIVAEAARQIFASKSADLIPSPVDIHFWTRAGLESQLSRIEWRSDATLRILVVANLNPLKGIDVLLEALSRAERPWHLKIVGAELATHRDYARALKHRSGEIATLGSGRTIEFLGWSEPAAVKEIMASCNMFVLPSRSEACPVALLEAMAMECVCIATTVGDVSAIITSPLSGYVVEPNSPNAMLHAICTAGDLPIETRAAIGQKAREKVVENHSAEKVAAQLLAVYDRLNEAAKQ